MSTDFVEQWERVLYDRIINLIPIAKEFWDNINDLDFYRTGSYPIPGYEKESMMYRITRTADRSPIKGIQAFPFVPSANLMISDKGLKQMIKRVCGSDMVVEGMKLVEIDKCHFTYARKQVIAFIPVERLNKRWERWMYVSMYDAYKLSVGIVTDEIQKKAKRMLANHFRDDEKDGKRDGKKETNGKV